MLRKLGNRKVRTRAAEGWWYKYAMEHSLYFHIPFCEQRCHYCDFITYANMERLIPDYMKALTREFRVVSNSNFIPTVHSIYFGGGTPSLIPVEWYQKLLSEVTQTLPLTEDCEITLEANPGTLSKAYLEELRRVGINRLSLGVQSTDTFDLIRLDRIHNINDVLVSVRNARLAGFTNLSLDLIFALPWQDLQSWQQSLMRALELKPEHFSVYALIIEPGTPLFSWYQRGWIKDQDQDVEADMYEYAIEALQNAGYEHYEISNWAKSDPKRDLRSRHNRQYWLNRPYFGFGAGAHGYVNNVRTVNTPRVPDYIQRMQRPDPPSLEFPRSPATVSSEAVDWETQMRDFMMLGLRLVKEGVSERRFLARYGQSMQTIFGKEINQLVEQGLVEWVEEGIGPRLRLTPRGILLANRVFREFV